MPRFHLLILGVARFSMLAFSSSVVKQVLTAYYGSTRSASANIPRKGNPKNRQLS